MNAEADSTATRPFLYSSNSLAYFSRAHHNLQPPQVDASPGSIEVRKDGGEIRDRRNVPFEFIRLPKCKKTSCLSGFFQATAYRGAHAFENRKRRPPKKYLGSATRHFEKMAFAPQTRFGIIPNQVEGCYMLLG